MEIGILKMAHPARDKMIRPATDSSRIFKCKRLSKKYETRNNAKNRMPIPNILAPSTFLLIATIITTIV